MRWQAAAREVIGNLQKLGKLQENDTSADLPSDGTAAWQKIKKAVTSIGGQPVVGWNKVWVGRELIGWWGELVTVESLRLATLEIESHPETCGCIREYLMGKWRQEPALQLDSIDVRLLAELGIPPGSGVLTKPEAALLERLNLDQRDQPFIERWRWMKSSGFGTLSDGGRIAPKPVLAWSRAIEAALDERGIMDGNIDEGWRKLQAGDTLLSLPSRLSKSVKERLIARLEFFGFGKEWEGGAMLTIPLGEDLVGMTQTQLST